MTDVRRLLDSTTAHEGYKIAAYKDPKGLWTFGIGRCLETHPLTTAEWKYLLDNGLIGVSISRQGAEWMEANELKACEDSLRKAFRWFDQIGDVRQNALIEMSYQLGFEHFLGFHDLQIAIDHSDWAAVSAAALDSKWAKVDSPERAKAIANMLLTGQWP